jgi:hypothetical protein
MKRETKGREEAHEFTWGIPCYGVVVDFFGPRRPMDGFKPSVVIDQIEPSSGFASALIVRPALSEKDASRTLPAEDLTRLLEEQYRGERVDTPFFGQSHERQRVESLVARLESAFYEPPTALPQYNPLGEEPGLFRTFASVEPSPEGILEFARRYGNLTSVCPILVWEEEVLAMRRALCVWDLLRKNESSTLLRHFRWRKVTDELLGGVPKNVFRPDDFGGPLNEFSRRFHRDFVLVFDSHPDTIAGRRPPYPDRRALELVSWSEFPQGDGNSEWDRLLNQPDAMAFARAYLRQVITYHFNRFVESRLLWSGTETPRRVQWTRTLLGALWLQFEQAITGRKEYRPCQLTGCGRWIEISLTAGRRTRKYCSDNHRVQAFQARKKAGEEEVVRASSGKRKEKHDGKKKKGTR